MGSSSCAPHEEVSGEGIALDEEEISPGPKIEAAGLDEEKIAIPGMFITGDRVKPGEAFRDAIEIQRGFENPLRTKVNALGSMTKGRQVDQHALRVRVVAGDD